MRRWRQLETEEGELLAYATRIESNQWPDAPKKVPFRFVDTGKKSASERSLSTVLRNLTVEKVQAVIE